MYFIYFFLRKSTVVIGRSKVSLEFETKEHFYIICNVIYSGRFIAHYSLLVLSARITSLHTPLIRNNSTEFGCNYENYHMHSFISMKMISIITTRKNKLMIERSDQKRYWSFVELCLEKGIMIVMTFSLNKSRCFLKSNTGVCRRIWFCKNIDIYKLFSFRWGLSKGEYCIQRCMEFPFLRWLMPSFCNLFSLNILE